MVIYGTCIFFKLFNSWHLRAPKAQRSAIAHFHGDSRFEKTCFRMMVDSLVISTSRSIFLHYELHDQSQYREGAKG